MKIAVSAAKEKTLRQMKLEETAKNVVCAVMSIFAFCILWHFGTREGTKLGQLIPGPIETISYFFRGFAANIGTYTMIGHVVWSFLRVFIGYVIAMFIGIPLGVAMGWSKSANAIARPIFELIRPIPPIAWIPLSIVWFGIGEGSKYFIIFLGAFTAMTINAYAGVTSVDSTLVGAARMLGANERQVFVNVVMPSAVPSIFAGLQIALSSSWGVVLAAEMIRSSAGLGWIIISGQSTNNNVQLLSGIIAVGVVGFISVLLMRGIEGRLCAWTRRGK